MFSKTLIPADFFSIEHEFDKFAQKPALYGRGDFSAILSNPFDLDETAVRGFCGCQIRIHRQNGAGTIFGIIRRPRKPLGLGFIHTERNR